MAKRKGVNLIVDEDFFRVFEIERQREQSRLRIKIGEDFNLTQRNFTAMLAAKKFRFELPKQRPLMKKQRRKRTK